MPFVQRLHSDCAMAVQCQQSVLQERKLLTHWAMTEGRCRLQSVLKLSTDTKRRRAHKKRWLPVPCCWWMKCLCNHGNYCINEIRSNAALAILQSSANQCNAFDVTHWNGNMARYVLIQYNIWHWCVMQIYYICPPWFPGWGYDTICCIIMQHSITSAALPGALSEGMIQHVTL